MIPLLSTPAVELSFELFALFLFRLIDWNVLVLLEGLQAKTMAAKSSVAITNSLYDIDNNSPRCISSKPLGNFLAQLPPLMQIADISCGYCRYRNAAPEDSAMAMIPRTQVFRMFS